MTRQSADKRGFTLAELLIVVAIIAVLAAIAIPIFTSRLESSREAVDIANLRSAYAQVAAAELTGESVTGVDEVTITQNSTGWTGDNTKAEIGGVSVNTDAVLKAVSNGDVVIVSVTDDGKASFAKKAAGGGGGGD